MIRINVMPPELRKAAGSVQIAVPWRLVGWGLLGIWVGGSLWLWGMAAWRSRTHAQLLSQWRQLEPERAQWDTTRQAVQALQQTQAVVSLTKGPGQKWAPRLNLLSDAVVPQLWLTSLQWADGQSLVVEGAALQESAAPGEEGSRVGQFLQNLKTHPQFQQWFRGVELQTVEHGQVAGEEVVRFSIRLDPAS